MYGLCHFGGVEKADARDTRSGRKQTSSVAPTSPSHLSPNPAVRMTRAPLPHSPTRPFILRPHPPSSLSLERGRNAITLLGRELPCPRVSHKCGQCISHATLTFTHSRAGGATLPKCPVTHTPVIDRWIIIIDSCVWLYDAGEFLVRSAELIHVRH